MRKTVVTASLAALAALALTACSKPQDQSANSTAAAPSTTEDNAMGAAPADNTADNTAAATNSDVPPGRGDPTRQ